MKIEISGTVLLDNAPLRRNFIDLRLSLPTVANPQNRILNVIEFLLTDNNGYFETELSIPSYLRSLDLKKIFIGVHAQNAAIRMLNSVGAFIDVRIVKIFSVNNGGTLNLTSVKLGNVYDHFRILAQSIDVYDTVWRQFRPFSDSQRNEFPLKRRSSVRSTFTNSDFAQIAYPSLNPKNNFVEPADFGNRNLPLVHLGDKLSDYRLFGINGSQPTTMPHELGHVYHFSALSVRDRIKIERRYLGFIVESRINSNHGFNLRTTDFVAFIEAVSIFSNRFYFFSKLVQPNLSGAALGQAFWNDELGIQTLSGILGNEYASVGNLSANVLTTTLLTGKNVEGRVYGAIFLHLAKLIGLEEVVGLLLESRATTFNGFKTYLISLGDAHITSSILTVENTWF